MQLDQPWYAATLGTAMRLHVNQTREVRNNDSTIQEPQWCFLDRCARRLIREFPDATRPQVEATLLHDFMRHPGRQLRELRSLGISPEASRIVGDVSYGWDRPLMEVARAAIGQQNQDALRVLFAVMTEEMVGFNAEPFRAVLPVLAHAMGTAAA